MAAPGGPCPPASASTTRCANAAGAGPKRHLATLVRGGAATGPGVGHARLNRGAGPCPGGRQPKKSRIGDEALGRSRGGLSTKIHVLVDALGNPLRLVLGPGQQADCQRAADLLAAAQGTNNVLADKGYDTDEVLACVAALGAQAVIPSKRNRLLQRLIDRNLYRDRNKVERFFSRLKQFRRLATRYDKTASSFLGMLHFVSAILWLR